MQGKASDDRDPLAGHPRYHAMHLLGTGTFGKVFLCRDKVKDELVAIKLIERGSSKADHKYVESEVLNHIALSHPHVIEFKEVLLTPKYLGIVMEYVPDGDLLTYMHDKTRLNFARRKPGGVFQEATARWFFQQVILALDYCHRKGVVNRDIKLENMLVQEVEGRPFPLLKICDFGTSKAFLQSSAKTKMIGTVYYASPELLQNSTGTYDGKLADIWSAGVVLYVLLFGRYPWEVVAHAQGAMTQAQRLSAIMFGVRNIELRVPHNVPITPECMDLLARMLHKDTKQRATMEQIIAHPWFRQGLPQGADLMNQEFLAAAPEIAQSEEEIMRILRLARTPGAGVAAPTDMERDDMTPVNYPDHAASDDDIRSSYRRWAHPVQQA